jgi:hypothetical protein
MLASPKRNMAKLNGDRYRYIVRQVEDKGDKDELGTR